MAIQTDRTSTCNYSVVQSVSDVMCDISALPGLHTSKNQKHHKPQYYDQHRSKITAVPWCKHSRSCDKFK